MKSIAIAMTLVVALSTHAYAQSSTARRAVATKRMIAAQAVTASAAGHSLPIRRVILYSNGVAYFERRGTVTGRAEINLQFKQSQVDDVLKSMVVLDLGKGRIGAVSYNSSAPPSARLNEIPFSIEAGTEGEAHHGGLAGVLRQLQGARVVVMAANRTATGAILTIEERKSQIDANKPPVTTHTLVIASGTGELASFDLADVRSVRLADEGARRDISQFADASASARRRDAKTIAVTSDGTGAREMVVSYTVAAPIWKTSYRVVLDNEGQPFFQGWAIVDNVSEEDWTGVSLSLVSGTPISFIQPIQQPLYRYRPVVPIPGDLKLAPQVHEPDVSEGGGGQGSVAGSIAGTITDANRAVVPGATLMIRNNATNQTHTVITSGDGRFAVPALDSGNYTITINAPGFKQTVVENVKVAASRPFNINVPLEVGGISETVNISAGAVSVDEASRLSLRQLMGSGPTSISKAITSEDSGVETAATGDEIGDLFEYRIEQPVTVRKNRSALIPILQTRMEGERVSIYNEAARRDRPMSGMRLKNISPLTLEDGSLTVLDGDAYAGEALLQRFKPGEKRFISFALDLGTLVTARAKAAREPVFLVKAMGGVLQAHFYHSEKKTYTITNQTARPRTVYIEHPLRNDWQLSDDTQKPSDKTARMYRFRVELEPRQSKELPVTERRVLMDSYALTSLTSRDVELFYARRYIDDATRAVLDKVVDLKNRINTIDARLAAIDRETAEISQDQARLRENIKALKDTAEAKQLIARYVTKADEQETRIEQLTNERRTAATERSRLQAELEAATRVLVWERKL